MQKHRSNLQSNGRLTSCTTMSVFVALFVICNVISVTFFSSCGEFDKALRDATMDPASTTAVKASSAQQHATTAFDTIVQEAYETVFSSQATPPPRNKFDLATWGKRGTGGLTDRDRVLLGEIYGNASSVFEFGLGESTYIASHVGVPRYAGIDSDAVWVGQSRDRVSSHFRFYLADVGSTGFWGLPQDKKLPKSVLDYQLAPLIVEPHAFDVYMVDGRMRFACMMASFLHASSRGGPTGHTIVLNHDCMPTVESHYELHAGMRKSYKAADHLLYLVHHSGSYLCAYRRKPTTTDEDLLQLWRNHSNDWS